MTKSIDVKDGVFKAFDLEGKGTRKSFISGFDSTLHFSPANSGFSSMRKWFSIGILSLLFVFATTGFYPSPHVFGYVQLRDLVSRSFGIRHLNSELSTITNSAVPESTLSTLTRSSEVQFDNYSLILRGQRIFLKCVFTFLFIAYFISTIMYIARVNSTLSGYLFLHCGRIFSRRSKQQALMLSVFIRIWV